MTDIYVSLAGNDTNSGVDIPNAVKTINKAAELVSDLGTIRIANDGAEWRVSSGEYDQLTNNKSFTVIPDSGNTAKIIFPVAATSQAISFHYDYIPGSSRFVTFNNIHFVQNNPAYNLSFEQASSITPNITTFNNCIFSVSDGAFQYGSELDELPVPPVPPAVQSVFFNNCIISATSITNVGFGPSIIAYNPGFDLTDPAFTGSVVSVTNTIFYVPTIPTGKHVFFQSGIISNGSTLASVLTENNNLFFNWTGENIIDIAGVIIPPDGTDIVNQDPLFTDPVNLDFTYQEGSPVLAAGIGPDYLLPSTPQDVLDFIAKLSVEDQTNPKTTVIISNTTNNVIALPVLPYALRSMGKGITSSGVSSVLRPKGKVALPVTALNMFEKDSGFLTLLNEGTIAISRNPNVRDELSLVTVATK